MCCCCEKEKCVDTFAMICQFLVIIAIVVYVISIFTSIGIESAKMLYILLVIYAVYVVSEFRSSIFEFLCHKTNERGIKNLMAKLVQTLPVLELHCECYHYETHTVRHNPPRKGGGRRRGGGKKSGGGGKKSGGGGKKSGGGGSKRIGGGGGHHRPRTRTVTKKVTTHTETVHFPYYSARDVSGLFQLDNSREKMMGKVYIKLELSPEINFADSVSYMDYENFRTDFYNRNRRRDKYMNYRETRTVPGLNPYNFILMRNEEPCGINLCFFVFFTIIPLCEIYKSYVNSFCVEQKFKIRKIISTRYDLNQEQYQTLIPSLDVPDNQCLFEPDHYNYLNRDFKVKNPTQEELNQAAQYNNKIPNYQCTSYTCINGDIKVGVVEDNPSYCSANLNEAPPPSCQDIAPQQPDNNMNNNMDYNNMNNNMNFNNMNNNMNNNTNINMNDMNNGLNSNNMMNNNPMNNNMNYNNNNLNQNNQMDSDVDDDDDDDDDGQGDLPYSGA